MKKNIITFRVWAPLHQSVSLHIVHPGDHIYPMTEKEMGYWEADVVNVPEDCRYFYRPGGEDDFPDPMSNFQPEGVHGPSQLVNHSSFKWTDKLWQPPRLADLILYELHTGTFTPEGTFEAIISKLDHLIDLGINAIEIMPVNQFPGSRNWGYDGVFPYAPQNSYGGPDGLKKLVNACHEKGIAVFLDVVYNHMGPEGNYLSKFGPYFTDRYSTPWGDALNFDGEWSDGVRDYFSDNAIYWLSNYHIDGLRCDAIHMIFDNGAVHFFEYLHKKVRQLEQQTGRSYYLTAESDLNSPKVFRHPNSGGYGFDAQWLDDFHHSLYTMLDKKGSERYIDYAKLSHLAKAYTDGFVLSGEWVKFRKRKFGTSSASASGENFVVFIQNHDQVGNRVHGERLSLLVDFNRQKIAAAAVLLSPYLPMLFMGQEFSDDSPFYYFVSHSDPELVRAVQLGRKEEFKEFISEEEPPDPQDEQTFNDSKLDWSLVTRGRHQVMYNWHKHLIKCRTSHNVFKTFDKKDLSAEVLEEKCLVLQRSFNYETALIILNFSENAVEYKGAGNIVDITKLLDSRDAQWQESVDDHGDIPPHPDTPDLSKIMMIQPLSVVVYLGAGKGEAES